MGWLLAVVQQETCGVCGGAVLRVTPEWIAFRAASDVWVARGGGLVDPRVGGVGHRIAAPVTPTLGAADLAVRVDGVKLGDELPD